MQITTKLLPVPTQRRSGIKNLGIKFIVCHDTGNDGSTALGNVNYYISSANDMQASAHYFVDDIQAINCIPEDEKAWHVWYSTTVDNSMFGVDANDNALSVELCYSTKGLFDSTKAYNNYCTLIAQLCVKYSLDPATKLIGHYTLDPARRTDPINAFSKIGKTWNQFITDVQALTTKEEMISINVPKSKLTKVLEFLLTL